MENSSHTKVLFVRIFWFGSFQSAFIEVAFGGNFVLDPIQSVFVFCIWREFVLDPFYSASIDAASGGKIVVCSF